MNSEIKKLPSDNTDGSKYCICEVCEKQFEQYYNPSGDRYTKFKMCPNCRAKYKKLILPTSETGNVRKLELKFTPHSKIQKDMFENTCRFNVYNCGARFGKDRVSIFRFIDYFIKCLNEDRDDSMVPTVFGWLIAPVDKVANQNWSELKAFMPPELIESVQNAEKTMHTIGGGLIEVRSAYDPESLVGVGLDCVILTEAARIPNLDVAWSNIEDRLNSPGRGLNGNGGMGIINSSPIGKNQFYKMWTWGQEWHDNYDSDWKSWTATTWDNPSMAEKASELKTNKYGKMLRYDERLKNRKGARRYAQDNMAEFLGGINSCFPEFSANCIKRIPPELTDIEKKQYIKDWQEPIPYRQYRIGYDPASINDEPPLVIKENSSGKIVKLVNMAGKGWNSQYDTIAYYCSLYNNAVCTFSKTGHETIAEELEKRGIKVDTVNEQGANKESMVINLEAVVQSGELEILYDESVECQSFINQMNDYSHVQTGSRMEYRNVEEPHDDWVSATYVAFYPTSKIDDTLPLMGIMMNVSNGSTKYGASYL